MRAASRRIAPTLSVVLVFAMSYATRPLYAQSQAPSVPASALQPATVATPPSAVAPTTPAGLQLEPHGYTYNPDGRRDPFVSLVRRGGDPQSSTPGMRPAGLSGLDTSEVTLKGTIASQGSFVGILQGVDNKTYIVRVGDRLLDGTIRTITQDSLVVTQRVTDSVSPTRQREVRKVLRQTDEAK